MGLRPFMGILGTLQGTCGVQKSPIGPYKGRMISTLRMEPGSCKTVDVRAYVR